MFERLRPRLFGIAYRMLGEAADAEDVVQEAWLRWQSADRETVADPEAYLVRVTTRLAIDHLRSARVRRERYVGSWLPEPLPTGPDVADQVERADLLSSAMLVLLESLSPAERAVLVLHEAFGYPYAAIAEFVDVSEAAARQAAQRARAHLVDRKVRYSSDPRQGRQVAAAFLAAAVGGDMAALVAVLAPEVTLVSDGGGLAPAPRRAIRGRELVANALLVFVGRTSGLTVEVTELNGGPAVIARQDGAAVAAATLHLVGDLIQDIHLVANPEKLARL